MPHPPVAPQSGVGAKAPPEADLLVGQTLDGRLRVLRPIGRGGMGTVYVAEHVGLGKQVAVKVLNVEYAGQPDVIARLHAEARNAAAILSQHIVDVFDIGMTESGQPYVVMELLSGESLAERLRRCTALSELDTLHIGRQLASALSAAHRSGIVHRDIKPENIFLCHREGQDFVKLLDFGISKAVGPLNDGELASWAEEEDAASQVGDASDGPGGGLGRKRTAVDRTAISGDFLHRLTRTGAIMGTPLYMSPEQARGERLDSRCDIYSLGVVLYECLTGSVPYLAPSYFGVIAKILTESPEPPSLRIPDRALSPQLERIVLCAMESDRAARYQTMDELFSDLERYQRGEPLRAGTDGSGREARTGKRSDGGDRREDGKRSDPRHPQTAAAPRGALPLVLPIVGGTLAVLLLGALLVFWRGPHERTGTYRTAVRGRPLPAPAPAAAAPPPDPATTSLPAPVATPRPAQLADRPPGSAPLATAPQTALPSTAAVPPATADPAGQSPAPTGGSIRQALSPRPARQGPAPLAKPGPTKPAAGARPDATAAPPPLPPTLTDEQAPNPFVAPAPN